MQRLIIIPFGPPGVGKGTQAKLLAQNLNIPHISSGDLFRAHIQNKTPLGLQVKELLDAGKLVGDEIVIKMIEERLGQSDCEKGFILDGVPRTKEQAEMLQALWKEGDNLHFVELELSDEEAIKRICGRLICKACGASYHEEFHPPKVLGVCDACGSPLSKRDDDAESVVRERLAIYRKQTGPITAYYGDRMEKIDGGTSIEEVQQAFLKLIGEG